MEARGQPDKRRKQLHPSTKRTTKAHKYAGKAGLGTCLQQKAAKLAPTGDRSRSAPVARAANRTLTEQATERDQERGHDSVRRRQIIEATRTRKHARRTYTTRSG